MTYSQQMTTQPVEDLNIRSHMGTCGDAVAVMCEVLKHLNIIVVCGGCCSGTNVFQLVDGLLANGLKLADRICDKGNLRLSDVLPGGCYLRHTDDQACFAVWVETRHLN